jgi:hypothetical protein
MVRNETYKHPRICINHQQKAVCVMNRRKGKTLSLLKTSLITYCLLTKDTDFSWLEIIASWLLRNGEGILDASFLEISWASHRWHARGTWEIPACSLLASHHKAFFTMENVFFSGAIPSQKTRIKNAQFSRTIYLPVLAVLLTIHWTAN